MRGSRPSRQGLPSATADALDAALEHWDLAGAPLVRRLSGSALRCVVARDAEWFVLRQVRGARAYLDYQVDALDHLASVEFRYEVPRPVPTRDGARVVATADGDWLLYRWLAGRPAPLPLAVAQASDLGRLVAETGRALASLALGDRAGCFRLPLFGDGDVLRRLDDSTRWLVDHHPRRRLTRRLRTHLPAIARARTDAGAASAAVGRFATPTIYDDWHRRNLVARHGRLTGLLDFDSIVEAPRIVDLANAVTHLLASVPFHRTTRLAAFAAAYGAVFTLSAGEAELAAAVLWDRLADLVAALLDTLRAHGRFDASAGLASRLVGFGIWLLRREARVTEILLADGVGAAG